MRKFYEDREESFTKPIKKKNKKLMIIIFLYLILIFLISLLPLVFASIQSPQRLFKHLYFLQAKSERIGFGASIITKFPFTIFLSDIFFGGFKPTIYYVEKDKPLILFEFSDSLSNVDNLNLFYDTQQILKVFDDGFKQTYTKDGKILIVKTVTIFSNYISFNFTFVESKNFTLTFFSPYKLNFENNFLKIDREECSIKLKLNSTKDKILVSQNTFQFLGSAEKEIILSFSVVEQDCIEKGIYDSLPVANNFKIFFVYPLIALLGIALLWWKYEYK